MTLTNTNAANMGTWYKDERDGRRMITEANFLKQVIDLAHLMGWRAAHFRHALQRDGKYITPVQADGAGFPDLVLVRERVIWAELKVKGRRLSDAQKEWKRAILEARGEYYIWEDSDFDDIVEVLKR